MQPRSWSIIFLLSVPTFALAVPTLQPTPQVAVSQPAVPQAVRAVPTVVLPVSLPEAGGMAIGLPGGSLATQVAVLTRTPWSQRGTQVSFPASGATSNAIRLMAAGKVSSRRNRCAGTMREAMGFGLGDAHEWTALPNHGYGQRAKGMPAQPGDVVVWPFTYGRRGSQHVGIAVGTENGTRLLSNLEGKLCLARLAPGYRAYYKDTHVAAPEMMVARRRPTLEQVTRAQTEEQVGMAGRKDSGGTG